MPTHKDSSAEADDIARAAFSHTTQLQQTSLILAYPTETAKPLYKTSSFLILFLINKLPKVKKNTAQNFLCQQVTH